MRSSPRLGVCVVGLVSVFALRCRAADVNVDRADYKITLPAGSTVDKEDDEVDADHLTTINLPNDNTMIIVVLDDKERAQSAFGRMSDRYKAKVKDGVLRKSGSFIQPKPTRADTVTGRLNGVTISFDLGLIEGKQKAFIVVFTYTGPEKATTIAMVQKAMRTFVIKE